MRQKLYILLFLFLSPNAASTSAIEPLIDSGSITHWQEGWSPRPIDLNVSNRQEQATLIFYIRTTEALEAGYIIEVTYPSDFNSGNKVTKTLEIDLPPGGETSIQLNPISLPDESKAYGPFRVVCRTSTNGQIKAMTNAFGSVYIKGDESDQNFTGITTLSNNAAKPGVSTSLKFSFELTTDVWPHDVFAITALNTDWALSSSPNCSSYTDDGVSNFFISAANDNVLNCSGSTRTVYIYGIAQEIDVDVTGTNGTLAVEFRIDGFTTPKYVTSTNQNSWSMTLWRGWSNYKIATWTGNGVNTSPGELDISSWAPHSDFAANNIVSGLTLYMDLTVSGDQDIPNGGSINFTFSNVDIQTPKWNNFNAQQGNGGSAVGGYAYVNFINNDVNLSATLVSTTAVTINVGAGGLPSGTPVTLTLLTAFSGQTAATVSAESSNGTNVIDTTTQSTPLNYAANNTARKCSGYDLYFSPDLDGTATNGVNITGDNSTKYIYFGFIAGTTPNLTNVLVKLYMPGSLGTFLNDYGVQFNNSQSGGGMEADYLKHSDLATQFYADLSDPGDLSTQINVTVQAAANSLSFNADISGEDGASISIYNASTTNTIAAMGLPRVESNLYTRYETYIQITQDGLPTYVAFKQISFVANTFQTATVSNQCYNIRLISLQTKFNTGQGNYKVKFEFGSDYNNVFQSGLQLDDEYPIVSPTQGIGVFSAVLSANRTILLSRDDSSWTSTTTYRFYTALQTGTISTNAATITMYFVRTDTKELQVVSKQTNVTTNSALTPESAADLPTTGPFTISQDLSLPTAPDGIAGLTANTDYAFVMQFPQGFDITGGTLTLSDSDGGQVTNPTSVLLLGPNNFYFKFPTIIGHNGRCPDADCGITVANVSAPRADYGSQIIYYGTTTECHQDTGIESTIGAITIGGLTGDNIRARGPDSYSYTLSFTLTPDHPIPEGGTLSFSLNSDWKRCNSSCTFTDGTTGNCGSSNNGTLTSPYTTGAITVTITDLLPPGTNGNNNVVSQATSTDGTGNIDQSNFSNNLTIVAKNAVGQTQVTELKVIPPNASLISTDLYFHFSMSKSVPSGTVLKIIPPQGIEYYTRSTANNYVFFSKKYSSVSISATSIDITLDEKVDSGIKVELYVEDALDNPSTSTSNRFTVQAEYTCSLTKIVINNDADASITTPDSKLQLTVNSQTIGVLAAASVQQSISNAGEPSTYTFTFSTQGAVESTDEFWIKFPRAYDEVVGTEQWPSESQFRRYQNGKPDHYYLSCSSEDLGVNVECTVDHRIVRVFNVSSLSTGQSISIVINYVLNPAANNTANTFKIYHVGQSGNVKSANENITGVSISALPNQNITIKDVSVTGYVLQSQEDYIIQFQFDSVTLQQDNSLSLLLPRQYQTNLTQSSQSLSAPVCSLVYYDVTDDVQDNGNSNNSGVAQSTASTCSVSDNEVSIQITEDNATNFNSGYRFDWKISQLVNPSWGNTRLSSTNPTGYYDAWDSKVFSIYNSWTYQMQVGLFDNTNGILLARSFQNVNGAWLGFDSKYRGFQVNKFSPKSLTHFIYVISGTQSLDFLIETMDGPLAASKAKFQAALNEHHNSSGTLSFSSIYYDWTMFANEYSLQFRVGASKETDQGIYYIDWSVEIEQYKDITTNYYNPPAKTMIEVNNTIKALFEVTPATGLAVEVGKTSIPIMISTDNAPYESVDIELSLSDQNLVSKITLSSQKLNFIADRNQKYFTIAISTDYDITTDPTQLSISFELSGVNAGAYSDIGSMEFNITAATSSNQDPQTPTLAFSDPLRTSVSLSVTSSANPGIIYWYCAPDGDAGRSKQDLKASLDNYFQLDEEQTSTNQTKRRDLETKPADTDTFTYTKSSWSIFMYRLYKEHLNTQTWSGAHSFNSSNPQNVASLNQLVADTHYKCWAYVQDRYSNISQAATGTFTTDGLPEAIKFEIKFVTTETTMVQSSYESDFKKYIAEAFGVQPERLINFKYDEVEPTQNTTGTAIFTWDVPALRHVEGPTPANLMKLTDQNRKILNARIATKVTNPPEYKLTAITAFSQHTWDATSLPAIDDTKQTSVSFQAACTANVGFICADCVLPQNQTKPNHNQVLVGLNENNDNAIGFSCTRFESANEKVTINVSGLTASTQYKCYFQCFNDYPVWPGYIAYDQTNDNPIYSLSITTLEAEDTNDESSEYLRLLFAILIAVLLQLV